MSETQFADAFQAVRNPELSQGWSEGAATHDRISSFLNRHIQLVSEADEELDF